MEKSADKIVGVPFDIYIIHKYNANEFQRAHAVSETQTELHRYPIVRCEQRTRHTMNFEIKLKNIMLTARYGSNDYGDDDNDSSNRHLFECRCRTRTDGLLSPVRQREKNLLHIWLCSVYSRASIVTVVSRWLHIEINCAVFGSKFYCARNRFPIVLITHYTVGSVPRSLSLHLALSLSIPLSLSLYMVCALRCEWILFLLRSFVPKWCACVWERDRESGNDDDNCRWQQVDRKRRWNTKTKNENERIHCNAIYAMHWNIHLPKRIHFDVSLFGTCALVRRTSFNVLRLLCRVEFIQIVYLFFVFQIHFFFLSLAASLLATLWSSRLSSCVSRIHMREMKIARFVTCLRFEGFFSRIFSI